ncbi:MAG: hypothetical protein ACO1OB_28045 [Archangium sp.]
MKKLLLLAALALSACPAPMPTSDGGTEHEHEGEVTRGRLLVADGTAGKLTVIDLDDGTTPGTFTLQAPATVYGETDDTLGFGYLVQRTKNVTQLVNSGVGFQEHDGHFHLGKEAPTLLSSSISGQAPTHLTLHDGWLSIFNDGDGTVDSLPTSQLAIGMVAPRRHQTGLAHHGIALVAQDTLLASVPDPVEPPAGGTRLPVGMNARGVDSLGTVAGEFTGCPLLHGEAANDTNVLFGCSDGVLALTWNGTAWTSKKIANPAGVPATTRVGTLVSSHDLSTFVGNFGSEAIVIIDPAAGTMTPVTLPTAAFSFKLFHDEHLLVLTLDGKLHKLDPATGASQGEPVQVIPAYAMAPTGHDAVRPGLAIGADCAYVSDPRNGKVVEVAIEHWEVERTFDVAGAPASLGVISASPDFGEHHDHEHEHEG